MNKAELKELYGSYCDTDKLVDDIMHLLTKYRHKNSEHGVCTMLMTFFENKIELIKLFQKSEHYIGDLRIMLDIELERDTNRNDVYYFCDRFSKSVNAKTAILEYKDEAGKTLADYMRIGIPTLTVRDLMDNNIKERLVQNTENKKQFVIQNGSTVKSNEKLQKFESAMGSFCYHTQTTFGEDMVTKFAEQHKINVKLAPTMKTSRAFNRVCAHFGVDRLPKYNKLFAQYSDMVSGLKRKMKFYISLNPIDYLTMSFGNSWASCHTIDKANRRSMPNSYSGGYCGGTMSYMLDKTSFITFVHSHVPENIIEEGKVYRNMFHYGENMLVQGRVYPQGNDGNKDLYKIFRGFVQTELSSLLEISGNWVKSNTRPTDVVCSEGVHYRDYSHFNSCNVSYPKEIPLSGVAITVGHSGICPNCGRETCRSGDLNCNYCY